MRLKTSGSLSSQHSTAVSHHQRSMFPVRKAYTGRAHTLSVRCMASGRGREKSWSELAGDAVQLVKTAATKVVDTVSETAAKFVPRRDSDPAQSSGRDQIPQGWRDSNGLWPGSTEGQGRDRNLSRRRESEFSDLFGGGLLGRGMGRFMQSAMENLEEEMRKSSQGAADIKERAIRAMESDSRLTAVLGRDIRIIPGMDSQSSSTSYINGQMRKQVTVGFLVSGGGATAQAQASNTGSGNSDGDIEVQVRLPDGRLIAVDANPSYRSQSSRPSNKDPIDVEWREVK